MMVALRRIGEPEQVLVAPDGLYTIRLLGSRIMSEQFTRADSAQQPPIPDRIRNLSGKTLSGWLVVSFSRRVRRNGTRPLDYWLARCPSCGFEREFQGANLVGGRVATCEHGDVRRIENLLSPAYAIVPGHLGYIAGIDGSVWSCHVRGGTGGLSDSWRTVKAHPDQDGYLMVNLKKNGRSTTRRLTHVILEAFVGPCPAGMEACHSPDPDPKNNRLCNLRWDTHQANITEKIVMGTVARGESIGSARLTENIVRRVRYVRETQGLGYKRLAKMFGITSWHAYSIVTRKIWKHI